MKDCFGYVRISTLKQGEGVSLEAQQEAIRVFASQNSLAVIRWFEEKETAAKTGRPVFSAMLKLLRRGAADGLIIHKIDRSARNLRDWAVISELSDSGVDVYFATESLDFRSRGGRLVADIQAVIAADFIRNLRDETKKGMEGRLRQGLWPYKAPLGYLDCGRGQVKQIDPIRGPFIRQTFELYATGNYSLVSLTERVRELGLRNERNRPISLQSLDKVLRNPFYCGLMMVGGVSWGKGQHEPLIPVSLFDRVTAERENRYVKHGTLHHHFYQGLFRCADCGGPITGEVQKGHVYYRCHGRACRGGCVRQETIDAAVQEALEQVSFAPEEAERLRQAWSDWYHGSPRHDVLRSIELRLAEIETRLSRLTDLLIDGTLDRAVYSAKKYDLTLSRARLAEEQDKHLKAGWNEAQIASYLARMTRLPELYLAATFEERRQIIRENFAVRKLNGRQIIVEVGQATEEHRRPLGLVQAEQCLTDTTN